MEGLKMGKIFEEKADQTVQRRKAFEAPLDGSKTPAVTISRTYSPAVSRSKLSRMELLAEEFNLFLDNTIFLHPLFNAIDGVQNSRVVAVETAADGLKR
jgi:hypothetical protein